MGVFHVVPFRFPCGEIRVNVRLNGISGIGSRRGVREKALHVWSKLLLLAFPAEVHAWGCGNPLPRMKHRAATPQHS